MRKMTLVSLVLYCCWLAPGTIRAWDPSVDEKCFFNGGGTGKAGVNCVFNQNTWKSLSFNVTVGCHNQCTGGTWTANSPSVSVQGEACDDCPLYLRENLWQQQSDQLLEYFSEARVRATSGAACTLQSTAKALVQCKCPGCGDPSPILISLSDNAFELTSVQDGVEFDLDGDGVPEQTAWTARNSDEGFLALDRNLNGEIDDFMEVFGNHSPQLPSDNPNGWHALAVWDDSLNGGTEDGVIDGQDEIFRDLLIWVDKNHNGRSEPSELSGLEAAGIDSLSLDYDPDEGWVDDFGNGFRYPSPVRWSDGSETIAWDVFFGGLQ